MSACCYWSAWGACRQCFGPARCFRAFDSRERGAGVIAEPRIVSRKLPSKNGQIWSGAGTAVVEVTAALPTVKLPKSMSGIWLSVVIVVGPKPVQLGHSPSRRKPRQYWVSSLSKVSSVANSSRSKQDHTSLAISPRLDELGLSPAWGGKQTLLAGVAGGCAGALERHSRLPQSHAPKPRWSCQPHAALQHHLRDERKRHGADARRACQPAGAAPAGGSNADRCPKIAGRSKQPAT